MPNGRSSLCVSGSQCQSGTCTQFDIPDGQTNTNFCYTCLAVNNKSLEIYGFDIYGACSSS